MTCVKQLRLPVAPCQGATKRGLKFATRGPIQWKNSIFPGVTGMLTLSGWITTQVPPSSRAAADAKA
ncbi:hypothetical protein F7O87_30665, partial [Pseudomonas aeruginosa]